ncbi:hypothetical protein [Robertmurraya siralis]|uniref:hypothetical protein n=1 Tax=Robertmurraya siralis TaxID=77777 RepID=UPI0010F9ECD9|nr:hypothetical protein [Robertmurraya siralis]
MDSYFEEIVNSLSIEDLSLLGLLHDNDAEIKFKAIKKKDLQEQSNLSEANFRKSIYRLEIAKLIEIVTGQKEHKVFITNFGQKALNISLSKEAI